MTNHITVPEYMHKNVIASLFIITISRGMLLNTGLYTTRKHINNDKVDLHVNWEKGLGSGTQNIGE